MCCWVPQWLFSVISAIFQESWKLYIIIWAQYMCSWQQVILILSLQIPEPVPWQIRVWKLCEFVCLSSPSWSSQQHPRPHYHNHVLFGRAHILHSGRRVFSFLADPIHPLAIIIPPAVSWSSRWGRRRGEKWTRRDDLQEARELCVFVCCL